MGYRNYIATMPKTEHDKIKNYSKKELYAYKNEKIEDGYVGVYDIAEKPLYELGKYVDEFDKKYFSPVFNNKDLQKEMTDEHDFYIVEKDFLEAVIIRYGLKVRNYYNEMLKDFLTNEKYPKLKDISKVPSESIFKIVEHVRDMSFDWGCSVFSDRMPYDLEKGDAVTTSWKYEYAQFELVRIYKTFDWDNNIMIYYGY